MDLKTQGSLFLLSTSSVTHLAPYWLNMRQARLQSYGTKTADLDAPAMVSSQSNTPKELLTHQIAFMGAEGVG